ncbi:hypothetical protein M758_7G137300 [Ceratodon purpureus]|nr:hypothetical protein M758_7G137300 [Ceratodon purpureus]
MQKALLVASRTSFFGHFGGGAAAVSVRLQNGESRIGWKGMVTKAGQQVDQAGDDPKGEVSSSDEENESRMHPDTRKAYRDDMEESYGVGYATRASEMGYGERYGEAVKAVLDKKGDKREMQRGATAERDQDADAFADTEYDSTQGEPVAEKEVGRNSVGSAAFESKPTVHKVVHEEKLIYKEKTVLE